MDSIIDTFESLLSLGNEFEWFDFKKNWFSKDGIGEYISALSNGAALAGKEWGYLLWGIEDAALQVVGTDVNLDRDIDGEPYKHYLARNLKPSIPFTIETFLYEEKRIVMMRIPAAKSVETRFRGEAYFRLGPSKEKLSRFPEWGLRLASVLNRGYPTITNVPAPDYIENLTFQGLFMYYGARGLELRKETFEKTLRLRTPEGEWNVLAYILSDQNSISIRVSVFSGTKKYDPLFSVKEFGNKCILYSLDQLLEYGDAINIAQADERGRVSERKDIPLFDIEAFREAVLNAFVHGKWLSLLGPTLSIFTDRIEIVSVGGLAPEQTKKGFLDGASIPVNESLASLFLQLRLSERSGRGGSQNRTRMRGKRDSHRAKLREGHHPFPTHQPESLPRPFRG